MTRLSSLDDGYTAGMLSVYPEAKDTEDTLFRVANNAETLLKQSLAYNGKTVIVDDTSKFPDTGLLRIGPKAGEPGAAELMYYGKKTTNTFQSLVRGFAGSRQNQWPNGSAVTAGVMAEIHNAARDAVIQIENNIGLETSPLDTSLNGILEAQEVRFLAPKPLFRAFPTKGPPPLKVRFQNFSGGALFRFLWDFGDGTTSIEKSPLHTYRAEGIYSVKLNMITSTGAQGFVTKSNYIVVSEDEKPPFFYFTPKTGYSVQTAAARTLAGNPTDPTEFLIVDQTDGKITQRYWIFDDGTSTAVDNPNIHTTKHTYTSPGEYSPSLLIIFSTQSDKRVFISDTITVL